MNKLKKSSMEIKEKEKEKELYGVKFTMDSNVRKIYCEMYPHDYQRMEIRKDLTFRDVWNGLCDGKNIYNVISEYSVDSEVRVRIMEMISILKECYYVEIWNLWLSRGEFPLWIPCREDGHPVIHLPKLTAYD